MAEVMTWADWLLFALLILAPLTSWWAANSSIRHAREARASLMTYLAVRESRPNRGHFLARLDDVAEHPGHPCADDDDQMACLLDLNTQLASEQPESQPEPRITYSLPGQPTTGRTVSCSATGVERTWKRRTDGTWELMTSPEVVDQGDTWSWSEMLNLGTLELLPLTDAERESELLYGPVGARWGDPGTPCPYREYDATAETDALPGITVPLYTPCYLGVGHIGAHEDRDGNPLGMTEPPPPSALDDVHGWSPAGISPGQSAATGLCTCGHPAVHEPGCPRYARISGEPFIPQPGAEPPF